MTNLSVYADVALHERSRKRIPGEILDILEI